MGIPLKKDTSDQYKDLFLCLYQSGTLTCSQEKDLGPDITPDPMQNIGYQLQEKGT